MIEKTFTLVLIGAAAFWYWNSTHQETNAESYAKQIEVNAQDMARCKRAEGYANNNRRSEPMSPEQTCAKKYNLYQHDGRWHKYDASRAS